MARETPGKTGRRHGRPIPSRTRKAAKASTKPVDESCGERSAAVRRRTTGSSGCAHADPEVGHPCRIPRRMNSGAIEDGAFDLRLEALHEAADGAGSPYREAQRLDDGPQPCPTDTREGRRDVEERHAVQVLAQDQGFLHGRGRHENVITHPPPADEAV